MADQLPSLVTRTVQAARYLISGITPQTWMSPLQPLAPMAPPETKGRAYDYQVSQNLNYRPRSTELVGFPKLRALAENCNILRIVLERQKDLIEAMEWGIKPREEKPGRRPIESKYAAEIKAVTELLRKPDRVHDWAQWLRSLLEDVFVIDAASIYRRPAMDGTLYGLELVDGATITPLIDGAGRRPLSPDPAYQQVLKGIPVADFTIEELIYYPKNPRTNRLYGYSPVQQIIETAETAIQRLASQRAYFTDGNLTDGIFIGPTEWTVDQIRTWQTYWDDMFEGNVANRRHGWWVPAGSSFEEIKQPALKDEFDEWIARIVCFAFSTNPGPFIKAQNRSNQESQQEVAEDGGVATYMAFIKRLIDAVLFDLGLGHLEFRWASDREFDPLIAAQIQDTKLRNGSLRLNEAREDDGEDSYGPDGDVPIIFTAQGGVPLKDVLVPPEPPAPAAGEAGGDPGGGGETPPGSAAAKEKDDKAKEGALAKAARPFVLTETGATVAQSEVAQRLIEGVLDNVRDDVSHQVVAALLKRGDLAKAAPATGTFVRRYLTAESAAQFRVWAQAMGFEPQAAAELHVTVVYSETQVDLWARGGTVAAQLGGRTVEPLGPNGAVVLRFESDLLQDRWAEAMALGAQHKWPSFTPHVTITWDGTGVDLASVEPYDGALVFGPEVVGPINPDWKPALAKADEPVEPDPDEVLQAIAADAAAGVDLSQMDALAEQLQGPLGTVARDGGGRTLVQVGPDDYEQLTNQVDERATRWARDRSAELVGKRWTKAGELIDNPNPRYAITEGTRTMLRQTIYEGLRDNIGIPAIADRIRVGYAFSEDRAKIIAHTEIRGANVQGSLEGAREAEAAGVGLKKEWLLGQKPCPICIANHAQGPIALNRTFRSGDDGPPAHPSCYCSITWEVTDPDA